MNEALNKYLFPQERINAYAIIDGAMSPDLLDKLYGLRPEFECLLRGEMGADMAEVAPYLVRLDYQTEFARWVTEKGWGEHCCIFALSRVNFREMRNHFRRLLVVYDTEGRPLHFRYYDPRVLRVYLPTCNAEELATFFGEVACFLLEDESEETMLRFTLESGSLRQEKIRLSD
jgi:hypothetical protein